MRKNLQGKITEFLQVFFWFLLLISPGIPVIS